ncbi:MAG: hypothetical protein II956_08270 [Bacteroidales bacterium]|nr:hypothetical protein [Bacteroidales bacterium]
MNITIEINDAVATNALSSWVSVERDSRLIPQMNAAGLMLIVSNLVCNKPQCKVF